MSIDWFQVAMGVACGGFGWVLAALPLHRRVKELWEMVNHLRDRILDLERDKYDKDDHIQHIRIRLHETGEAIRQLQEKVKQVKQQSRYRVC